MNGFYSPSIDPLEQRQLMTASAPTAALPALVAAPVVTPIYTDFVSAEVVGRHVFYNNSKFDGNLTTADTADDNAIATDKVALVPGVSGSFDNYTSYSRGINGIMVDVAGLPSLLTADDFEFRVGNSADPGSWITAPEPSMVTVRQGAGAGGSARVTITWPDYAIESEWLQVTLKASVDTGLKQPDVFYFGNEIGEAGDNAGNTVVNVLDSLSARNHVNTPLETVPITSRFDYNRDAFVNLLDEVVARRGANNSLSALRLFTPPTPAVQAEAQPSDLELFNPGDGGFNLAFGPNLVKTNAGTVLAFAEGRWADADDAAHALIVRRSTDNGVTWSPVSQVYGIATSAGEFVGNAAAVVDATTGQIFLLFTRNNSTVFVVSSSDDGLTWTAPRDITTSVKVTSAGNPNPAVFASNPWGWYATGPVHGIQLENGPYAGRLIISCDHRETVDTSGPSFSHIIYSDDHGLTWHLGGGVDEANPLNAYSNESTVVELADGTLYMSMRIQKDTVRGSAWSYDGGATWTTMQRETALNTLPVQGSLLRVNATTVLLSSLESTDAARQRVTIWASYDNMQSWVKTKAVFFGYAAYSDMVLVGPDTVLLAYTRGHSNGLTDQYIALARFNLRWLQSSDPYEFDWDFNEKAPGEKPNIAGNSIQDSGPWDARGQAQAASPDEAPVYVAGPHDNDSALRLSEGSDSVQLTPAATNALQFGAGDSFTAELVIRTTDADGVLIGTNPDLRNWTLKLVGGAVVFSVNSGVSSQVTGTRLVNDGQWHHIAVVRDAATRQLRLYVDRVLDAAPVTDNTGNISSGQPVRLGAFNDGSSQLALDVDRVRVTRAVLTPGEFISPDAVAPPRPAAPNFGSDAPNTIANLRLWLPAYDPAHYFSDLNGNDPLPATPTAGTAVHSVVDASDQHYLVSTVSMARNIQYVDDPAVGSAFAFKSSNKDVGTEWVVQNSNGTTANNFDFVQNTGVFTLSAFVKTNGGSQTIFDTAEATAANPGFSLVAQADGSLRLMIFDSQGNIRFSQASPAGLVLPGSWYHVAAVGNGAGGSVTYYVTAISSTAVKSYTTTASISGADGEYPTDANHNLTIGARSFTGHSPANVQMVDQAIYDRALTRAEIQQLFDYTKKT